MPVCRGSMYAICSKKTCFHCKCSVATTLLRAGHGQNRPWNIRFMRIISRGGSAARGRQTTLRRWWLWVVGDGYFRRFWWLGLRLQKRQRYTASSNIWRYATKLVSASNWLQSEWPWMALSAYFMSKSVFGQHFSHQSVWMSKLMQ